MKIIFWLITSLIGAFVSISCTKEYSCEGCRESNKHPIANAGPDQTIILPKDSIILDASASTDADGTIKSYKWINISGPPSSVISKSDASKTSVTKLIMGVYKFELTVTDNLALSAKDTVQIIVDNPAINQTPIANAGPDQTITLPTDSVILNASGSTDPDNNIKAYAWTKISGPTSSNILNAHTVQTQVTSLEQGVYLFQIKVTDEGGLFSKDTVQISVIKTIANVQCASNRATINPRLVPIGTLSKPRSGMAVASAGNKILYAGGRSEASQAERWGMTRVDIYDINTNTWSTAELSIPRFDITAVAVGNKVFFAGGMSGEIGDMNQAYHSTVDIYDVTTNTWTVTAMSEVKYSVAAAAIGNKVFFAGGLGLNKIGNTTYFGHLKNNVEIYDLATNTWSSSVLSEAKVGISAVTLNNKIYFAGGTLSGSYSSKLDIFDNSSGSWSASTLSEPKTVSGIAVGNKIYWAGGYNGHYMCKVEVKDVNTQTTLFDNLSEPAFPQPFLKGSKIVYYKGSHKFEIYDYIANTWAVGVLSADSPLGTTMISVNNTIYAAGGGRDVNGVFVPSTQVYKLEF